MNTLSEILSSRTRAEIFKLLFGPAEEQLHVREIERRSGLNDKTIRQELTKLLKLDLVIGRKDSNRIYFKANKSNPLYPDIWNIVLKSIGMVDVLKGALQDKRVQIAFVFGSISQGKEIADSDMDLFVIGQLGMRAVSTLLSGVAEKIGRKINSHVMTRDEFNKRRTAKEHFLASVINSPRLFIVGTEDDLKTMAE
jgi:uncharacterized protein